MAVRVSLPWPDKRLSPNARVHWRTLHHAKAAARALAFSYAWADRARDAFRGVSGPIAAKITFRPPDRRKRDRDNMIASFKAYQDGVARCTGADDSQWIPTYHVGDLVAGGRVIVELEPVQTREVSA